MDNPILHGEIQLGSKMSLTYQLMMIIKRNIASENLKPGSQLPTEEELCTVYNISRSTVRNALAELEEEGLIDRVRGKGTFISQNKLRRKMEQVYSFTHEMINLGLSPTSKILEFEKVECGDMTGIFALSAEDFLHKIMRVRMANNEPLLLETTYIPMKYYGGLTREKLDNKSLYDLLSHEAGIYPNNAEETYESIAMEKNICELLDCQPRTPGFFIERFTRLPNGKVYELTQSFMRGDRSKIVLTLQQDSYSFNRNIKL